MLNETTWIESTDIALLQVKITGGLMSYGVYKRYPSLPLYHPYFFGELDHEEFFHYLVTLNRLDWIEGLYVGYNFYILSSDFGFELPHFDPKLVWSDNAITSYNMMRLFKTIAKL